MTILSDDTFKELTGYSYEMIGIELETFYSDTFGERKRFILVNYNDLSKLFERVRELAYESGQNNILENTGH